MCVQVFLISRKIGLVDFPMAIAWEKVVTGQSASMIDISHVTSFFHMTAFCSFIRFECGVSSALMRIFFLFKPRQHIREVKSSVLN